MDKGFGIKLSHWLVATVMMATLLPCLLVIAWLLLTPSLQGDSSGTTVLDSAQPVSGYLNRQPGQAAPKSGFLALFFIACLFFTYAISRHLAGYLERDLLGLGKALNGAGGRDLRFRFAEFKRLASEVDRIHSDAQLVDQARRESEDRLKLVLSSGGFGTWDWDLESGRLIWDEHTHDLYGVTPGKFSGSYDDFLMLLHPDDRDVLYQQLTRMGESRETEAHEVEFRIKLPSGRERTLADRSEVFFDNDGRIERIDDAIVLDGGRTVSVRVDGRIGGALEFDGTNDHVARVGCKSVDDGGWRAALGPMAVENLAHRPDGGQVAMDSLGHGGVELGA